MQSFLIRGCFRSGRGVSEWLSEPRQAAGVAEHSWKTAITPRPGSKSTLEPAVHTAEPRCWTRTGGRHATEHLETTIIKSVANYLICKCWGELPEAPAYVAT